MTLLLGAIALVASGVGEGGHFTDSKPVNMDFTRSILKTIEFSVGIFGLDSVIVADGLGKCENFFVLSGDCSGV